MKLTKNDTIAILSHYYKRANAGGGPPQELRDFLVPKVGAVIYIEHPFPYADDLRSSVTVYENGQETAVHYTAPLKGPEAFFYLADIFITWYLLWKVRRKIDLCVALDNLNSLSVLPFRWFGQIKHVVFYTIDYTPKRFQQPVLNLLYMFADRLACKTVDTIWVLSERMKEARRKAGVKSVANEKSVVVPMGAKLNRIERMPYEKINRQQLVFVGHLLEKQGLQLVFEALPEIVKRAPKARIVIVGQGEYELKLRALAKKLKIEQYLDWQGFVERHEDVEKLLCQSAIGLAPYIPSEESYTYFTDPGKPKLYLGCGLPVVITDFPASAQLIAEAKAGIIIDTTVKHIEEAVIKLLTDDKIYKEYRSNAIELSRNYDTDTLLANAIKQTNSDE
jgi:glycosyltransferase involved in cell wall biosynthesis